MLTSKHSLKLFDLKACFSLPRLAVCWHMGFDTYQTAKIPFQYHHSAPQARSDLINLPVGLRGFIGYSYVGIGQATAERDKKSNHIILQY